MRLLIHPLFVPWSCTSISRPNFIDLDCTFAFQLQKRVFPGDLALLWRNVARSAVGVTAVRHTRAAHCNIPSQSTWTFVLDLFIWIVRVVALNALAGPAIISVRNHCYYCCVVARMPVSCRRHCSPIKSIAKRSQYNLNEIDDILIRSHTLTLTVIRLLISSA